MKKFYKFLLHPTKDPISEPVTKFGGQPCWISEPEWPLNRQTGKPMSFVCQIELYPELFGSLETKMAYIFMTENDETKRKWQYLDDGDAVIMQPNGLNGEVTKTEPLQTGPAWNNNEFSVELLPPSPGATHIGGKPSWLQYPQAPFEKLLLQLHSRDEDEPFPIIFGRWGIGYVFISKDGRRGEFLYQV